MSNETIPNQEQSSDQKQYTDQEIKEMRDKMRAFYKEETPFLELQVRYETAVTTLEELKQRKLEAMARYSYLYQSLFGSGGKDQPENPDIPETEDPGLKENGEFSEPTSKRTLRRT